METRGAYSIIHTAYGIITHVNLCQKNTETRVKASAYVKITRVNLCQRNTETRVKASAYVKITRVNLCQRNTENSQVIFAHKEDVLQCNNQRGIMLNMNERNVI